MVVMGNFLLKSDRFSFPLLHLTMTKQKSSGGKYFHEGKADLHKSLVLSILNFFNVFPIQSLQTSRVFYSQ